jgi:hypothetical protein
VSPLEVMWDMRRNLNATPVPPRRSVDQVRYPELPIKQRRFWLVADPESGVDLCDRPGI